jgi:hypothetical protein
MLFLSKIKLKKSFPFGDYLMSEKMSQMFIHNVILFPKKQILDKFSKDFFHFDSSTIYIEFVKMFLHVKKNSFEILFLRELKMYPSNRFLNEARQISTQKKKIGRFSNEGRQILE